MPELPEVEVVRVGLAPAVTGAVITAVTVFDERSLRRHEGPSEDFIDRLTGRRMLAPRRRGKFLWIPLLVEPPLVVGPVMLVEPVETPLPDALEGSARVETPPTEAIVVHLGMSGQVLLRTPGTEDLRTRIRLEIEHPEHGPLRVNFVDQRIFGSMSVDQLVPTADSDDWIPTQVAHIARDPIDPLFDDARFVARLRSKSTTIKRALLDQTLVSGIGNIYADESLWAARIHYDQPTAALSAARIRLLLTEVRAVLTRALDEGGTSFDAQYLNVNGQSGYFAHSLRAYGQHGKPCPRCGRPIVREQFMNRGSHFCPRCQRIRP